MGFERELIIEAYKVYINTWAYSFSRREKYSSRQCMKICKTYESVQFNIAWVCKLSTKPWKEKRFNYKEALSNIN